MAANDFAHKLGIRAGQHVYLEGAPAEFVGQRLADLPYGCRVATVLANGARPDMVILWLKDKEGLEAVFQRLRYLIAPDGAVWAVTIAQPVLWFLWKALPQTRPSDVLKLVVFLGVLAFMGNLARRGRLPRTRPILPGETVVAD